MTYKQIQDEVIALGFNALLRPQVKNWINVAYQRLWGLEDWDFKRVPAANLAVSSATPAMPADFAKCLRLYDERGDELDYLEPNKFEVNAAAVPPSTGRTCIFTVINRQIRLYPTPTSATYKLSYKRRLSHVDAALGIIGGIFVEDTDQPLWPAEHDYVLVFDAIILGQRTQGNPAQDDVLASRQEMFAAMREDLITDVEEQFEVWGEAPAWR